YDESLLGQTASAAIAAFAEEIAIFPTEEAYLESQTTEPRFSPRSLIPSGMFNLEPGVEKPPTAHVLMSGVVVESDLRLNTVTGLEFWRARLESFQASFDLVVAPIDVPSGLPEGSVVKTTAWLIGRIRHPETP
ncbi:MAG: hypothetical protein OEV40_30825, partial [Acidimicrobiia bacterium]|nr:hypothetical protein [Acidimicrobiia bacterium]